MSADRKLGAGGPPPEIRVPGASPPGMKPLTAIAIAAVALAPLVAIGIAERDVFAGWISGTVVSEVGSDRAVFDALGARRGNVVIEILRAAEASGEFRPTPGNPLPPVDYINRKLHQKGEKWRVSLTPDGALLARDIS